MINPQATKNAHSGSRLHLPRQDVTNAQMTCTLSLPLTENLTLHSASSLLASLLAFSESGSRVEPVHMDLVPVILIVPVAIPARLLHTGRLLVRGWRNSIHHPREGPDR